MTGMPPRLLICRCLAFAAYAGRLLGCIMMTKLKLTADLKVGESGRKWIRRGGTLALSVSPVG